MTHYIFRPLLSECVRYQEVRQRVYCSVCVNGQYEYVSVACVLASVALCHFTHMVKPLCLLQSGISNESSRGCHVLADAIQYKSSLPSVQCCGYITQTRAMKCWNIRWISQPGCLAFTPSNVSGEERVSTGREGQLYTDLQPQKSLIKERVMGMLLLRGHFTSLELNQSENSVYAEKILHTSILISSILVHTWQKVYWKGQRKII